VRRSVRRLASATIHTPIARHMPDLDDSLTSAPVAL
jgi:hypothetical protein